MHLQRGEGGKDIPQPLSQKEGWAVGTRALASGLMPKSELIPVSEFEDGVCGTEQQCEHLGRSAWNSLKSTDLKARRPRVPSQLCYKSKSAASLGFSVTILKGKEKSKELD